ncbi:unnamed protein product [Nippostrongylus brasiliensis]|uniref:Chromosome 1 open reading frame 52 n=1 Tax=Nippostrongylus brasiliensis TaxID=27835 RepID=A0A0N4XPI6_NIPBR|nr:unnamed protein product [Nippostrongylus brasiliensis]
MAPEKKKSEFEPDWADEQEETSNRKPTASTFGARKDPHWWDISTFNKVSCGCFTVLVSCL